MLLTLTLAAGLLAVPEAPAEPKMPQGEGWVVEVRGYHFHEAKPEGWIIEVRGFHKHRESAEKPQKLILEFVRPEARPALKIEPVESHFSDDLSAFFQEFETQVQIDAVEGTYVDDLPAFFQRLQQ